MFDRRDCFGVQCDPLGWVIEFLASKVVDITKFVFIVPKYCLKKNNGGSRQVSRLPLHMSSTSDEEYKLESDDSSSSSGDLDYQEDEETQAARRLYNEELRESLQEIFSRYTLKNDHADLIDLATGEVIDNRGHLDTLPNARGQLFVHGGRKKNAEKEEEDDDDEPGATEDASFPVIGSLDPLLAVCTQSTPVLDWIVHYVNGEIGKVQRAGGRSPNSPSP